ncbi:hypothetical protein NDU88_004411 [Pleurodeles waltl]|uniref:Uncharacterized protein n=1 Tax=Pleurodeles waltl TaxID=8319 RepID=A0AAV7RJ85_PLEWA|nr:hypothetical protein NDU88_004411 [Pleurodeles waltl]
MRGDLGRGSTGQELLHDDHQNTKATNQKEIQEVCEGLANKLDLLAQRTQALEVQVEQMKDPAAKNIREIEGACDESESDWRKKNIKKEEIGLEMREERATACGSEEEHE